MELHKEIQNLATDSFETIRLQNMWPVVLPILTYELCRVTHLRLMIPQQIVQADCVNYRTDNATRNTSDNADCVIHIQYQVRWG